MNLKTASLILISSFALAACGGDSHGPHDDEKGVMSPEAESNGIVGSWQFRDGVTLGDLQKTNSMTIKDGRITSAVTCAYSDGENLIAAVVVPADVTGDTITLQRDGEAHINGTGNRMCQVNVKAGNYVYAINGDTLTMPDLNTGAQSVADRSASNPSN